MESWLWTPVAPGLVLLLLWFPTGAVAHRAFRPAVWAAAATFAGLWLSTALPRSAWVFTTRTRPKRPRLRRLRVHRRSVVVVLKRRAGVKLRAKRRRAGGRHSEPVKVSERARLRDRRLRPGTVYIYRVTAVDPAGVRSPVLRLKVRTRR